jgi:transcription-repair coupling factor (superfamily II helicase)
MSRARGFLQDPQRTGTQTTPWAGLGGDALAFALSHLAPGKRLIVVDGSERAERLVRGLRFFSEEVRVCMFPEDDGKPYDGFSRDPSLAQQRTEALEAAEGAENLWVVATARALQHVVPSAAARASAAMTVAVGEELERDQLIGWLQSVGYLGCGRVETANTFAARGDVLDLWPAGVRTPLRIEFFDDEVECIRTLDPTTGRPGAGPKTLKIRASREVRLDEESVARLHSELGKRVAEQKRGVTLRRRVIEDLKSGIRFSALEDYLPGLVECEPPMTTFGKLEVLVDAPDDVAAALRDFEDLAQQRWDTYDDEERALITPKERYASASSVLEALSDSRPIFRLAAESAEAIDFEAEPSSSFALRGNELGPVVRSLFALADEGLRVGLVVDGERRARTLQELFNPHVGNVAEVASFADIPAGKVRVVRGDLSRGFVCRASNWALIPTSALFGAKRTRATERAHVLFTKGLKSTEQMRMGDAIVHRTHGVGRYRGLQRLEVSGAMQDFVELEYRDGDLLYLPVTRMDVLCRYTPARSDAAVKLDKLGGQTWERKKGKVRDNLLEMAQELLSLFADRELAERSPYSQKGPLYAAFEEQFPHVETPDQLTAVEAVLQDLSESTPMDRLICGDVGFGKTEVAMRGVMRVVEGGGQVAVLCPTTVLAHQHLRTFRERFRGLPVRIEMLSRFVSPADGKKVRSALKDGRVQVVVGTHALLSSSVRFDNLRMLVIDEEHRFGVRQKERFRKIRSEIDVLALSATPIPRTLQMALSGVRDMSVMATPPRDRLSVRTTVCQASETRVRDAIRQELRREGQCYVIHNRVESIARYAERLREWVPEARVGVAHGQMNVDQLENVLVGFIERRIDVLVCTSIVENGIDLPNVNTMLIDRADRFGLSQLYQLRGRVGRSDVRASCLLMVPEDVTRDARRRLRVLVENTELGSGFQVAAADLEIRGGGNLLGAAQSGNIDQVGYETWVELLSEAVNEAKGRAERQEIEPEVKMPVSAFIPEGIIPDVPTRLEWYRRFSTASKSAQLEIVHEDWQLEFGDLPPEVQALSDLASVRMRCKELAATHCAWLKVRLLITLHPNAPLSHEALTAWAAKYPKRISVNGAVGDERKISVRFTASESQKPLRFSLWVLAQLAQLGGLSAS